MRDGASLRLVESSDAALSLMVHFDLHLYRIGEFGTYVLKSARLEGRIPVTTAAANVLLQSGLVSLASDPGTGDDHLFLPTAQGHQRGRRIAPPDGYF